MALPKRGRRAPERTGNAPSKIEQLGGPLDQENSEARGEDQALLDAPRPGAVIGVDPGVHGALALITCTGDLVAVADMPILRDGAADRASVNAPLLADLLAKWHAREVFVEFVSARPNEGAVGAFSFGRSRGVVEGVAAVLGLPIRFLTPPAWKRLVQIAPGKADAKDAARAEAIRRWPDKAALFARVRDDGRAEAALIAAAGLAREA